MNNERSDIRNRMIELGIDVILEHRVTEFANGKAQAASVYRESTVISVECGSLVVVGARKPDDSLFRELNSFDVQFLRAIGDCRAPGSIAHAVYSGHEYARMIDSEEADQPFEWERPRL